MNELRRKFFDNVYALEVEPTLLSVAVKLPNGAIETITNTQELHSKIDYYMEKYDDEFKLIANTDIQIVGYMIV